MLAKDTWDALLQAELATAREPASAETWYRVANVYEEIGSFDSALAVLRKAASFEIENVALLPVRLRIHRKQRQFAELNAAMHASLAVPNRNPELRRELALAWSSLGQFAAAEQEWASLIRAGGMNEAAWLNCARWVMSCAGAHSLAQVAAAFADREDLGSNHLAGYCKLKCVLGNDRIAAQKVLGEIDPAGIADAEILLDLAILAWRLRDYVRAENAATLAAASAGTAPGCRVVMGSIRSFAGDFSSLREVPMSAADAAGERVIEFARGMPRETAAWGYLFRDGLDSIAARILNLTADTDMILPDELDVLVSFSILPDTPGPDPFLVLSGIDWSWPHLLLQRTPGGDVLHFFVEGRGRNDWLWEEVRPKQFGRAAEGDGPPRSGKSAAWIEVLRELSREESRH